MNPGIFLDFIWVHMVPSAQSHVRNGYFNILMTLIISGNSQKSVVRKVSFPAFLYIESY